tara:strand:- start:104 stop:421 length:318 start_codon:yes stop_codon:yes gene_type:complete
MSYASDLGYKLLSRPIFEGGVNKETLSGNKVLNEQSETFHLLTLDQARDLNLPPHKDGLFYIIRPLAHTLTVKDSAGVTVATVSAGIGIVIVSDGTDWSIVLAGA